MTIDVRFTEQEWSGPLIKAAREKADISLETLAKEAGVAERELGEFELGADKPLDFFIKVRTALKRLGGKHPDEAA